MQDEINVIKPGRYKIPVDADARRDEFDLKNGEVLYSGRPVDIVFTGDSITHFMEANLYYGKFGLVLNRGIGGDVADILAWRFHADVTQLKPHLCIVLVGVNNIWELDNHITKKGQYLYGILLGVLTGLFRLFGGSAEGVSYAIIISNLFVPLIEKITLPKPFGKGGEK